MSDALEEILARIQDMTSDEKKELAKRIVTSVSSMAFDIVAQHEIAKRQGRPMLNEAELGQIVANGVNIVQGDEEQSSH